MFKGTLIFGVFLLTSVFSYSFEEYTKDFNRNYQSEEELAYRRDIFTSNYNSIQ